MSQEKATDSTDGDATRQVEKEQIIPGVEKFDDFIRVNRYILRLCLMRFLLFYTEKY